MAGAHHQRQVVGLGRGGRCGRVGREHLERRAAHGPPVAGDQHDVPGSDTVQHLRDRGQPVVARGERPGGHLADPAAAERAGQPRHVVGVEVRQEHQGELVDAQPGQAGVDRRPVGTGVDQHPGPRAGRHHERVTLTDVAGDHHRAGHGPAPGGLPQRPAQDHDAHEHRQRERPAPGPAPQRPAADGQQHREQDGSRRARRPAGRPVGDRGRALGDADQPAHRPAGEPGGRVGQHGRDRGEQRRDQPEHGGRGDRGRGDQVGRQGDEADHPGEGGHQRSRGETCGGADRQRVGRQAGHAAPPQGPRPRRRQQHDGRGGHHRQRETAVAGQPGLGQEQDDDRRRQRGDRRPGTPGGEREQTHPAHRRRAQHAGPRPGQHDEQRDPEDPDQRLDPPVGAAGPQRPQQERDDDRHVGPGHGGQVREPGPAELVGQHVVHRPGVADHQPGQQAGRAGRQGARRRLGELGPEGAGGLLQRSRSAGGHRRRPGGQDGDDLVPRLRGADGRAHPDDLPGEQLGPRVRRPEQQHRRGADGRALDLLHRRGDQHPGCAGSRQRPGVVVHAQHDRHHRLPRGEGTQRRGPVELGADASQHGGHGESGQAAGQHRGPAGPGAPPPGQQDGPHDRRTPTHGEAEHRREVRGDQRDHPDGRRRRQQPQVDPGPARVGAHPPHLGGPAGSRRRGHRTVTRSCTSA